jgi:phosphogluconate dehydratase
MNTELVRVTQKIVTRSQALRQRYLDLVAEQAKQGKSRQGLSCGNLAHTVAACRLSEKQRVLDLTRANIAIISSYNDMLSAHAPYQHYPDIIKKALSDAGHTAQVAGCVPAMCDGVTQGQPGMELSLFSRDLIAQATVVSLAHNAYDGVLLLGVCDKIAPGLLIGALSFGHLPCAFIPSGPMPTGITNDEKVQIRQQYARGHIEQPDLLKMECRAYHSQGTCTFYGTANTNQLVFEAMGLILPGAAFVPPSDPLRFKLTEACSLRIASQTQDSADYQPLARVMNEKAVVNGLVALLASGGSTNHTIHLIAVARAAGWIVTWDDIDALSKVVPLLVKMYPNGPADINGFQQAGGVPCLLSLLARRGLFYTETGSVYGTMDTGLKHPYLAHDQLCYEADSGSKNPAIIAAEGDCFSQHGGLQVMDGNLGRGVVKVSAVAKADRMIEAPVRVFDHQDDVEKAYYRNEFTQDVVIVVRYNGPAANGMPELHKLMPILSNLMKDGLKVALVTDGRLSGASGKVPAVLHVTPEAKRGGQLSLLNDGDIVSINANSGEMLVLTDLSTRVACVPDISGNLCAGNGMGRELFQMFREKVSSAELGASVFLS